MHSKSAHHVRLRLRLRLRLLATDSDYLQCPRTMAVEEADAAIMRCRSHGEQQRTSSLLALENEKMSGGQKKTVDGKTQQTTKRESKRDEKRYS